MLKRSQNTTADLQFYRAALFLNYRRRWATLRRLFFTARHCVVLFALVPFVYAAPSITSLSPTSGPIGTSVTITGTNFGAQGTNYVNIYGISSQVTSWNNTTIVVTVPSGVPLATVNVKVWVGGVGSNEAPFQVTPGITTLSPTSGPVGTTVTVTGTNFGTTQGTITFNGVSAIPTSWSATSIVVPVPSGATSGNVVVTVGSQASNGVSFTVTTPGPSITSLSPNSGPVGASVTITGTNFGSTQGTVTFNGVAATPTSWSLTSIVVSVPSGATTGNVVVTVSGQASTGVAFNVTSPSIIGTSPPSVAPGMQMTVNGGGFGPQAGEIILQFPQTGHYIPITSFVSWSNSQIVFTVPNGLEQPANLVVVQGSYTSNAFSFTTIAPNLTSISPNPVRSGMQITLTGTSFGTVPDDIQVYFPQTTHRIEVTSFTSWTDTQIVFTMPYPLEQPATVWVEQNGDRSNSLPFTTIPATLSSISPTSIAPGMQLTLTGSGFGTQLAQVGFYYNNTQKWVTSLVSLTDTQIVAVVPSGIAAGNVAVWQNGVASNMLPYTLVSAPVLSSLSQSSGYVGTIITISGTNLGSSASGNSVTFNGTPATPTSWSPTAIVAPVPAGATTGNVVVTLSGLSSNGLPFTVTQAPVAINTVAPNPAPVGALITISGSGFGSGGTVTVNGVPTTTLTWSSSVITAVVPNTTSGNIVVTTAGSSSPGVPFTVSYNSPGTTAIELSYDPMGRVAQRYTCTPTNCGTGQPTWLATQNYDFIGSPTASSVYGVSFQQSYDAAGRVTQLTSGWVDAQHPATLATVVGYGAIGEINNMTLGNGLVYSSLYNDRLQPCRINWNTSQTVLSTCVDSIPSGNFQDFSYAYDLPSTTNTNNGDVDKFVAAGQQTFNRSYAYDNLNRIQTMSAPGDQCTGLTWSYDAWGNRTAQNTGSGGGLCFSPQTSVDNQNHLFGAPYQYDAAGNLTKDANHSYFYDAENRLIQVDGNLGDCTNNPANTTACYVYDAMGARVEKNTAGYRGDYLNDVDGHIAAVLGNNTLERMYVYMGGSLLAEYFESTTYFVHRDHLGSTRLLSRLDQSVRENDDYYPFGESISTGTGSTLKFTGKERDSESGLDNFGARYDTSSLGRFMTADSITYSGLDDPQSLNLYSYVGNNPLTFVDPDGHCFRYLNWACSAYQRFVNWSDGNGFRTDKQIDNTSSKNDPRSRRRRQQEGSRNLVQRYFDLATSMTLRERAIHDSWNRWWAAHDCENNPFGGCGVGPSLASLGLYTRPMTRVGRWMNPDELEKMRKTGRVQESYNNGVTSVTVPPNPNAYKNVPNGDVFVEFDVPASSLTPIKGGWGKIYGPSSVPYGEYYGITEMPEALNIVEELE